MRSSKFAIAAILILFLVALSGFMVSCGDDDDDSAADNDDDSTADDDDSASDDDDSASDDDSAADDDDSASDDDSAADDDTSDCTIDEDCNDNVFCNGDETCSESGSCVAGGNPCFGETPFCDETNDLCFECETNADCEDDAFCNGDETCSASGACVAGSDPCIDPDFPNCNETSNECEEVEKQPLSRTVTALSKAEEMTWLLPRVNPHVIGWIRDDEAQDRAEMGIVADMLATNEDNGRLIEAVNGDVDGDGKDEIVVASIYTHHQNPSCNIDHIRITIVDDADNGFLALDSIDTYDMVIPELALNASFYFADIALGDFDGDNKQEIALSGSIGYIDADDEPVTSVTSIFWVFDDAENNFAELHKENSIGPDVYSMTIASGDFDGDEKDEIVVMGKDGTSMQAWAYDDHDAGYVQLYNWRDTAEIFCDSATYGNVAIADVDGDSVDEIIFLGNPNPGAIYWEVYKFAGGTSFSRIKSELQVPSSGIFFDGSDAPAIRTGDFDGNGKQDVIAGVSISNPGRWQTLYYIPSSDAGGLLELGHTARMHIAVGDSDRDGLDEILIARPEEVSVNNYQYLIEQWEYELQGTQIVFNMYDSWAENFTPEFDLYGNAILPHPLMAMGDYDGDNMVVKYTGEHWISVTDPRIVVAMAMPPVWNGITQDYGSTYAGFGESSSYSEDRSTEVTVSAGITISVSGGDPFGIIEVEASTALEMEFSKTQTTTNSVSLGIRRYAYWNEDEPDNYVVFAATRYHCYKYEIIRHPNPEYLTDENKFITIDVPLETNTFKQTVAAYNDGGTYMPIGDETFRHTLGDPGSYRTRGEMADILYTDNGDLPGPIYDSELGSSGWSMPPQGYPLIPVDLGGAGGTELSIEISEDNSSATSLSLGVTMAAGLSVAGVGFEASVGVAGAEAYSVTVGDSTTYDGSVGEIHQDYYDDYYYNFGLFVYNFMREDGMKYQIMDWVVDIP